MPGCPVAGSAALFWISAFIGSKHWQRYPPPSSAEQQCTDPRDMIGGGEEGERDRQIDRGEREREEAGEEGGMV